MFKLSRCFTLLPFLACVSCVGELGGAEGNGDGSQSTAGPGSPMDGEPPKVGEEFACNEATARPGPNLVRRLTSGEYTRTVRDLLGVDISAEADALPDLAPTSRSFNNNAVELTVSASHVDTYAHLAAQVVARIGGASQWVTSSAGCTEYGGACEASFVDTVGQKLLRAPLVDAERDALLEIFAAGAEAGAPFEESALYATEAMLQSPRFLYRMENELGDGGVRLLSGFEVASRLSYAVWGSAPDQELLDAAASGALSTDQDLLAQIERMLGDPRAEEAALEFLSDWFDMHRLETFLPNPEDFPDFDPGLIPLMVEETRATFSHVVNEGLALTDLFDLQQTTVRRELAEFYRLPEPQEGLATYDLSAVPERGGILTQGALHSIGGSESSTVRRGLFYLYQLLCGTMQEPPEGVDTTPPPLEPGQSIRDISSERVSTSACAGCHEQFEPLVWGMVPFDATGKFNTVDHYGNTLPQDGYVVFPGDWERVDYATVGELMSALSQSERVRDCSTIRFFEFVMGRSVVASDSCSLDDARDALLAGGASYAAFVRAIAMSDNFKNIQTEAL